MELYDSCLRWGGRTIGQTEGPTDKKNGSADCQIYGERGEEKGVEHLTELFIRTRLAYLSHTFHHNLQKF